MGGKQATHEQNVGGGLGRRVLDLLASHHGVCLDEDIERAMNDIPVERVRAILSELRSLQIIEIPDSLDRGVRTVRLTRQGVTLARGTHKR